MLHVSHIWGTQVPIERDPLPPLLIKIPPCPSNPLLTGAVTLFFPHFRDNVSASQVTKIQKEIRDGQRASAWHYSSRDSRSFKSESRMTLIVGRPPRLTPFWIISSQNSSNFQKFPLLKFSISSWPGWQAGVIKVTLIQEKEFTNRNTWVVKQKLMMKTASKCQTVWIYSSQSWWEWTLGCGLDHENKSSLHFIVSSKILPLYVHWQAGKARLAPGRKIIVEER